MRPADAAALLLVMAAHSGFAQAPGNFPLDRPPLPGALNSIPVPLPANLSQFVVDTKSAIVLGKAFFWDQQAGSDGLACASCHFHAGADNRIINQLDPGLRNVDPALQNNFHLTAANRTLKVGPPAGGGPNYTLKKLDYPFHQLSDPNDRNSVVLFDTDDITSSQGVFRADFAFMNLLPNTDPKKIEVCTSALSTTFSVGGINTRQVEPRNTPTMINAIFNFRNFWDSRANNIFNGRNPFGMRDPSAGIDPMNSILVADSFGNLSPFPVVIPDASLASQAVGPPGSDVEMSATGRPFVKMGKKMLMLTPLALQQVAPDDSVLGSLSAAPGNGLNTTYISMIQAAFLPKWWSSNVVVDANSNVLFNGTPQNTDQYSQMEYNFSMFWGVAIQMYESTLVADNSRFDQFMEGNRSALTSLEQLGLNRFEGKGGCINCHNGAEFTDASVSNVTSKNSVVEQLPGGRWHDIGFHNIGVRPTDDDLGIAASDPSGLASLSVAQLASMGQVTGTAVPAGAPVSVSGAVKTPGLRNIELTAPFFLNGGQATLSQVVDFYSHRGDFPSADMDPNLERASFGTLDKLAVVAFLKSLTDERVRNQSAPFDHPSLTVPNGATVTNGVLTEQTITIPATGSAGGAPMARFCDSLVGGSSSVCQ